MNVKMVYTCLIINQFKPPAVLQYWKKYFHITDSDVNIWKNIWCPLLKAEESDLWFKLKHKILPTKDKLYSFGITDNDICLLCKKSKETIEHLFIECDTCYKAWLLGENIVKYLGNPNFYLFDCKIILGINIKDDMLLLLIGKLHKTIWNIRCKVAVYGSEHDDILHVYKNSLKNFILMENGRLGKESFNLTYVKNKAMCYYEKDTLKFTFWFNFFHVD